MALLLILAIGMPAAGGLAAVIAHRSRRWSTILGVGGAVTGAALGLVPVLTVLGGRPAPVLRVPWDVPYGAFSVELDALSAFFLLPTLALSALAAVYGAAYLREHGDGASTAASWLFFDLLLSSMVVVLVARNAVLFLVAWELMALASFFLVTFEDTRPSVRDAGRTYLVASHLGTAFLLALFLLLGRAAGSLDFARFAAGPIAGTLFVLAFVGFGTKAGFMPLHVWLPEAHPAAPTHVSAVMSAVMIKTGLYGLVRTWTFLGPLPSWCGPLLIAVGLLTGVLGILFALGQSDLKRLLAYSSVENVGIVALGLGVGLVGLDTGAVAVAALGFAGALAHVVNHALFKGLLFLGAGAVIRSAGTRDLDALGGLLRRMPWTGVSFFAGAAAIAGLPPLNGFAGELLVYLAALEGAATLRISGAVPALAVVAGLALIGGLAAACFAKTCGVVFLGHPRSDAAARAHEAGAAMRVPIQALAAGCAALGLLWPVLLVGLAPLVADVTGLPPDAVRAALGRGASTLGAVAACGLGMVVLAALLAAVRARLLARREVRTAVPWDCGYAAPSARMQYTGASFSQPLVELFRPVLRPRVEVAPVAGLFPRAASFALALPDVWSERLWVPAVRAIGRALAAFRWLQHGRVQLYVLYVALTLLVLLVWKLGPA